MIFAATRTLVRILVVFLAVFAAGAASPAFASPALTFTDGWIGQTSNNNNINNALGFSSASPRTISSVTVSQELGSSSFQIQGNDIPVTVTVQFSDGTRQSADGAIVWRETTGSTLRGMGLIFRNVNNIDDGYSVTDGQKTYLLKVAGSNLTIANGAGVTGNAALNQVLDSLNALLDSVSNFTISKSAPASVPEGASAAFTIGIGNSGGGTSGTSATVQDVLPAGMTFSSAVCGNGRIVGIVQLIRTNPDMLRCSFVWAGWQLGHRQCCFCD